MPHRGSIGPSSPVDDLSRTCRLIRRGESDMQNFSTTLPFRMALGLDVKSAEVLVPRMTDSIKKMLLFRKLIQRSCTLQANSFTKAS